MRFLLLQWGNANAKPNGPNTARTRMLDNTTDSGPKVATAVIAGDAVGLPPPHVPRRRWYIAIVGNNSEKLCGQRLLKLFAEWQKYGKDCEVYVPIQRVLRRLGDSGRRTYVERVVLPTYVFVRCTEAERRRDIAYLPFVKRFFVNIAGAPVNGHRPVATIPDAQMACLRRMIEGASLPVTVSDRPLRLGERVRVNGGKLVGLEGNVVRPPGGSTHLAIRIDALGCAMVEIARDLLDPMP